MLNMNRESLRAVDAWKAVNVKLPEFDVETVAETTKCGPVWVHFGAGNIFRGFIAALQQKLLNEGLSEKGIVAVETFDYDIIHKIYCPFDNLTMNVTLNTDGTTAREIIASITESLCADSADHKMMKRLKDIFKYPGLQMISFTITEKGYALTGLDGSFLPVVIRDFEQGPVSARHAMSMVTALLLERYQAGEFPLAVVSMDNCSHNGEKLGNSIKTIAQNWVRKGFAPDAFLKYIEDETKITFPFSMIDKITPRPADVVEQSLTKAGIADMQPIITGKNTYIAPFVNAEGAAVSGSGRSVSERTSVS